MQGDIFYHLIGGFGSANQQSQQNQEQPNKANEFNITQKFSRVSRLVVQKTKSLEINVEEHIFHKPTEKEMIQLGEELKYLTQLDKLQLRISSNLQANVKVLSSLKEGIKELIKLTDFSFIVQDLNQIESKGLSEISEVFKHLPLIKTLQFSIGSHNSIQADGLIAFGENLKHLRSLNSLTLIINSNDTSEEGFGGLVGSFGFLTELKKLSIIYSDSIKNQVGLFCQQLSKSSHSLKELDLQFKHNSSFDDVDCLHFGECLAKLQELTSLNLMILLTGSAEDGMKNMSKGLACLESLSSLQLFIRNLDVGKEGIASLGSALSCLQKLNSVQLAINDSNSLELFYLISVLPLVTKKQFKVKNLVYEFPQSQKTLELQISTKILNKGASALGRGISKLSQNLQFLTISLVGSGVGSEGMKGLSNSFQYLKNLIFLNINVDEDNQIEKEGVIELAKNLKYLAPQLIELDLTIVNNNLEAEGVEELSLSIGSLTNLEKLSFSIEKNRFVMKNCSAIGRMLKALQNMNILRLNLGSVNLIPAIGMIEIGSSIQTLQNLRDLSIQFQDETVDKDGIHNLALGIKQMQGLRELELNIGKNSIGQESGFSFQEMFSSLSQLQQLKLIIKENEIQELGSTCIGKGISELVNLKTLELELAENNISQEGYINLAAGISKINCLENISLKYAEPQGVMLISAMNGLNKVYSFEQFIMNDKKIKIEEITRNEIDNTVQKIKILYNLECYDQFNLLAVALNQYKSLQKLILTVSSEALLPTNSISTFVEGINQLPSLTSFTLIFNQENSQSHDGCELESLGKLVKLQELSIEDTITDSALKQITNALKQLQNLKKFAVKSRVDHYVQLNFTNEFFESIPNNIMYLQINLPYRENPSMIESLNDKLQQLSQLREFTFKLPQCRDKYIIENTKILQTLTQNQKLLYLSFTDEARFNYYFGFFADAQFRATSKNSTILYRKLNRLVVWKNQQLSQPNRWN